MRARAAGRLGLKQASHSQSVRRNQARILQCVIDSMADGAIAVTTEGQPLLFNLAAQRILRQGPLEILPSQWPESYGLYMPDAVTPYPSHLLPLARAMRGQSVDDVEVFIRHAKVPEGVWLRVSARPLKDSSGALAGGVIVFSDVTARKRVEAELRASREQLRELAARLEKAREAEKTRIAREIHDQLGHTLTAAKIDLSRLATRLSEGVDHDLLLRGIRSALDQLDLTIRNVRRISTELRPGVLDLGLSAAIEWQAREFQARTGIRVSFAQPWPEIRCVDGVATAVFRILQEILTNVARHADAASVIVQLSGTGRSLVLRVSDDGRGITAHEAEDPQSLGLVGMRERALLLGGRITLRGVPGRGTTVTLKVPLPPPQAAPKTRNTTRGPRTHAQNSARR